MRPTRVLLLFLDGVGIGPADPLRNPFLRARLPALTGLLGELPTQARLRVEADGAAAFPVDATLGVDGTPQSGTGQTTLLTGHNGAELFGRHFGPWVPVKLRPLVEEESLLRRALDAGLSAAFANAYPRDWPGPRGGRRLAGPPLAARGAGLLTRDHTHLARGEAVASEILNEGWRTRLGFADLPRIAADEAGQALGRIAAEHDLTLYAHYATDLAGHRGGMEGAVAALERVDEMVGGLLETLPADHLLMVCSDHGNVEDLSVDGHTRNPALGILRGPAAASLATEVSSLLDVAPAIARWLARPGA